MTIVSLAMPVHNGESSLPIVIESVLSQTYGDFYLTVLDDGSSDGSWEILNHYAHLDSRITLHRNERCEGLASSWSRVGQLAISGKVTEYFGWLSDHDKPLADWLSLLVDSLEANPGSVLAYPRTRHVNDLSDLQSVVGYGPEIDTRAWSTFDRLTKLPLEKQFAGDMIYGLIRSNALSHAGVFPYEILPDRLVVLTLALLGDINYEPRSIRYRVANPEDTAYRKPLSKQLGTLFTDRNRPKFPYLSNALYFHRAIDRENKSFYTHPDLSTQLYMGMLHAQYMANNYVDEIKAELSSPDVESSFPPGLIYFMKAGLNGDWQLLFANIPQMKAKLKSAYEDLNTCRERVRELKNDLRKYRE